MKTKIFLIGIILMLALSACSVPKLVKNDPTATPKPAQPTAQPTVPVEPTAVVPTNAPTQTPTEVKLPENLPVIPAELEETVGVGGNLLSESFDKAGSWKTSDDPEYGADVIGGAYRMYLNSANWMVWSETNQITKDNLIMEIDTELISGSVENNQGMMCRYVDDQNFYMLTAGNDGWVEIMKVVQGVQTSLFGEWLEDLVDPVKNHLQGFCLGDRLVLYVNGQLGADVRDSELASGDAGLIIGSYDDPQVTVDFDNFVIYEALGNFPTNFMPEPVGEAELFSDLANNWVESYSDDFETLNSGNWTIFDETGVVTEWRNGRLAYDFNETLLTATSPTNDLDLSDVVVQVDVYRVGDVVENEMGLICRFQDMDNYYSFSFGNDDYVTIYKNVGGTWTALFNEFVDTDLSAEYHSITVSCIGTELSIYIDEQLMARVYDSEFASGDVGIITGSYEELPVYLEFDNFIVYTPK